MVPRAASYFYGSTPSTDWRNGSASDSSPEGYAFESRIGHWIVVRPASDGTPTGNYARLQALAKTLKHPEAVDAPSQSGAYPCPFRVRCPMSTTPRARKKHNVNNLHY